jgi:putative inorganic carbon (HCO3(-)) transporter
VLDVKSNKTIWAQVLLMAALAPFFIFPAFDRIWILFIAGGWFVYKWRVCGWFFKRTVVDWAIFVVLFQVFISTLGAEDCVLVVPKVAGVVYGILVFYTVVEFVDSRKRIQAGVVVFLIGGVVLSIIGTLGMEFGEEKLDQAKLDPISSLNQKIPKINFDLPGAEEGFNPNALAGTLVLVFPALFAAAVYYGKKNKESRMIAAFFWSAAVFFLLEVWILFLTASRGSWMALTIALVFMVWIFFLIPKKKTAWLGLLMAGAAVILIFGYIAIIKTENIEAAASELESKYQRRQQAWSVGMRVINEYPLTGIGMNHVRMEPGIGYKRAHAHNHLIHTAAELGIPGLMAYLAILAGMLFMCWNVWWQSWDFWMRAMVLGLGAGQLAHFIWGMGDTITLGGKPGVFFWISLGLIAGIYNWTFYPQRHPAVIARNAA